jgi:cation diffusion facilitator family transporter
MSRTLKVAWGSLGISLVVLALKGAAYWVTSSLALYSDALETVINVVSAATAIVAIRIGEQPADANHPYGHQKAEYLSAVIEGALVLATAFMIGRDAYAGWEHPSAPAMPMLGLALNGGAGAVNLGWALLLLRLGRGWRSAALVASGRHIMTDVYSTIGVLVGFALIPLTGWLRLDPAIAGLVALNILWAGYGILRDSFSALMDEVVDTAAVATMRQLIATNAAGAIEAHDVRMRTAGTMTFVEFHLVVPARMLVEDAHEICDRIETAVRDEVGEALITIHIEPEHKAKSNGVPVL